MLRITVWEPLLYVTDFSPNKRFDHLKVMALAESTNELTLPCGVYTMEDKKWVQNEALSLFIQGEH